MNRRRPVLVSGKARIQATRLRNVESGFFPNANLLRQAIRYFEATDQRRSVSARTILLWLALTSISLVARAAFGSRIFKLSTGSFAFTYMWYDPLAGVAFAALSCASSLAGDIMTRILLPKLAVDQALGKLVLVLSGAALMSLREHVLKSGAREKQLDSERSKPTDVDEEPLESDNSALTAPSNSANLQQETSVIAAALELASSGHRQLASASTFVILEPFFTVLDFLFMLGYKAELAAFLRCHRCSRDVPCVCGAGEEQQLLRPAAMAAEAKTPGTMTPVTAGASPLRDSEITGEAKAHSEGQKVRRAHAEGEVQGEAAVETASSESEASPAKGGATGIMSGSERGASAPSPVSTNVAAERAPAAGEAAPPQWAETE